jgi:hypothetical protein
MASARLRGHGLTHCVAHCCIVEELGQGAIGLAHKIRNADLGRLLALKILRPKDVANLDTIVSVPGRGGHLPQGPAD